jgi:hypothetical protein
MDNRWRFLTCTICLQLTLIAPYQQGCIDRSCGHGPALIPPDAVAFPHPDDEPGGRFPMPSPPLATLPASGSVSLPSASVFRNFHVGFRDDYKP